MSKEIQAIIREQEEIVAIREEGARSIIQQGIKAGQYVIDIATECDCGAICLGTPESWVQIGKNGGSGDGTARVFIDPEKKISTDGIALLAVVGGKAINLFDSDTYQGADGIACTLTPGEWAVYGAADVFLLQPLYD